MAASDALFVTVRGVGGHGSAPHLGRDPVTGAAEMVTALQTLVTRRFDVFDPVVITVGTLHAGTRYNIIPDEATIRTFSAAARERVRKEAPALCRQVGGAYGLEVDVRYKDEYPVTVNDARHAEFGPDNHSPRAAFDDAVLPDGALLHAQLAVRALRRDAAELS
jgi:hippurate hydrolase